VTSVPARVVCISFEKGAGGPEVGRIVASELDFRYIDEEIVAEAAARGGISDEALAIAETRTPLARKVLEQLFWSGAAVSAPAILPTDFSSPQFRQLIIDVVRATADDGDCVIVAHAAGMALAGRRDVLRAAVTASPRVRAERLADSDRIELRKATEIVEKGDLDRASYFKRFYDVQHELPTHYDIVVNTDVVEVTQAAALIAHAAGLIRSTEG
jgi:hypothetical protein